MDSALSRKDSNANLDDRTQNAPNHEEGARRSSSPPSPFSGSPRPSSPPSAATTAFERPYDPPEIRTEDADIALQHLEGTYHEPDEPLHTGYDDSPGMTKNDYGYLGAGGYGSTFDSDTRSLLSTAKHYDHHESRKFLFKTGAYRFLVTLGFSVLIGMVLKSYEGFGKPIILSKVQVRYFNAIMLGLSLGLGLNLASSLKRRYVSLEVFDLILGLETLTKVAKLMIISLPGIRRFKLLRKLPWFREARDDGTKLTWAACALWILINIAAQVLVAALSLFWPVDPSDAVPLMTHGNVTVASLDKWSSNAGDVKWWPNITSMEAAWIAGMEAIVYPEFPLNETSQTDLSSLAGTPVYHDESGGFYEYRFYNRNPSQQFENYVVSSRSIQASASCQQLEIKDKPKYNSDGFIYIEGKEPGKDWDYYWLPDYTGGGCLNWIGSTYEGCGPRCTNFTVYQEKTNDNVTIKASSLFRCNSTVSKVNGDSPEFTNLSDEDKKHIYGNDQFARIAAGSIAWTGWFEADWSDRQLRSYLRGSKWSPNKIVDTKDVAGLLSRYTIGAIAAFDDHGIRYEVANQNSQPVQGQQLNVDWPYILGLLGGICSIQLAALFCLLLFGNKSVVRDESFLSMAMLLKPVMDRIPGKTGMNLSGDEIKNHPKLLWKRIRYDYREGKDGEPNQVDIFFQGRDHAESRRSWAPGAYS
ncbi:hypothetical protein N0V90_004020 [Kalmusia sp. IMI 367209]|nr:hypothetical protein N0V90_004020 [Kalmusia sp. IMI 367209]